MDLSARRMGWVIDSEEMDCLAFHGAVLCNLIASHRVLTTGDTKTPDSNLNWTTHLPHVIAASDDHVEG